MFCRLGAEEARTVIRWMHGFPYSRRNIHNIKFNAGVFPNDKATIDKFCETYTTAIKDADGIFTWGCIGESSCIKRYASKDVKLLSERMNYFLFYEDVWTLALEGKKVLVVHPFINTIKNQYKKREILFNSPKLPVFANIQFVKAIQSNAGENQYLKYESWSEALKSMKLEIDKMDFEVALIAAGSYGLPLAAYVKSMGKQAIHIASNLQVLFGIRGRRWDNWSEWKPYFNENWAYPSDDETPKGKNFVEGGSYWK